MFQFKSMQPKDFEEEMANKMRFKRNPKMGKGKGSTPVTPVQQRPPRFFVAETQPQSTPVRLKPNFTCYSLCHHTFTDMFGTVTVQGCICMVNVLAHELHSFGLSRWMAIPNTCTSYIYQKLINTNIQVNTMDVVHVVSIVNLWVERCFNDTWKKQKGTKTMMPHDWSKLYHVCMMEWDCLKASYDQG